MWNRAGTFLILAAMVTSAAPAQAPAGSPGLSVKGVTGTLQLRNAITVEVDSLQAFLRQPGKSAAKFVLYLDWRPIGGLKARAIPGTDNLVFDIERSADSKGTWDLLLGRPFSKGYSYPVPVSVGYEGEPALKSDLRYGLQVIRPWSVYGFIAVLLFGLVVFRHYARTSPIIRDARGDVPAGKLPPYSLGKSQMAFWFFLVFASYLLIWIVTGDPPPVTESTLALMGISAATALGAVIVANSKAQEVQVEINAILAERQGLTVRNAAIDQLLQAGNLSVQVQEELAVEKARNLARIEEIDRKLNQESQGFWKDIMTDADGISLHRFQIVVWTMVLGTIFLVSVYKTLGMPEFGGTMVALMGISAGTYIGFKFPEKQV